MDGDVLTFSYNGSKIAQIKNLTGGSVTTFTYSGDLISQTVVNGSNTSAGTALFQELKIILLKQQLLP